MYHVIAVLHRDVEGWTGDRPLPTFYLDPRVQGIVSREHAQAIAADIVLAFHKDDPTITATITATLVDYPSR